MKIVAVIPARAGSKEVKSKNTRRVAGLPLWMWTYRSALKADTITEIRITTNLEEILAHPPLQSMTTVIRRPPELAADVASLDDAVIHAIEGIEGLVVVLQPTCPVRAPGLIDGCVREFLRGGFNSLVTVNELHVVWKGGSGHGGAYPVAPRVDRQEIKAEDQLYEEDGSIFIVHTDNLREAGTRVVPPVLLLLTERTVDIDTENDLALAERLIGEGN